MAGYTGLANTILHEYNFFDYGIPHETTKQAHSLTKYEYWDFGGGDETLQIANPGGSVSCLIKVLS